MMLAVNAQLPVRRLGDLIALAKVKPGELNYGAGARCTDVVDSLSPWRLTSIAPSRDQLN